MDSELKMSELYLALQGEQCYYTRPSAHEGFILKNASFFDSRSSIALEEQLQRIVKFSSCVKAVEAWKEEHIYNRSDCLDSVKKAILESLIEDYNAYQKEADLKRQQHELHRSSHSIVDLCAFARTWQQRLSHLLSLLQKSDKLCGLEMMNFLFDQWTYQCCIKDWRYKMIEKSLLAGAAALHQLLVDWLLKAKLPPVPLTRWFIRPKTAGASVGTLAADDHNETTNNDSSQRNNQLRRSFTNSVLSAQLNGSMNMLNNSNTTYQNECLFEPEGATNNNNQTFFGTMFAGDGGSIGTGTANIAPLESHDTSLILEVQLDKDILPTPFYGCHEVLKMIMDIGRKVHFLKVLRSEHSHEQQLPCWQTLCDQLPTNVWCTPSAIGRMATVLQQIHAMVSEEMGQELMGRQRLMDHLCLVHGYFFMLRGDFASALEHTIFIKTAKTTNKNCATPFSSRKKMSHSAKIAEKCVNDALALCTPPTNVADLMRFLCAGRLNKKEQTKCKILSEKFMLKSRLREEQLINESFEFRAIAEFFSSNALRAYRRVFNFVSNLQLQRAQLDCTGQNLLHVVRKRLATRTEFRSYIFSMLISMQKVRVFLNRLAIYVFEEVLLLESIGVFKKVRAMKDPFVLLTDFYCLLNGVLSALFLQSALSKLYEVVQQCIRSASDFVGAVNKFCLFIEHSESDDLLGSLLLARDPQQFHSVLFAIADSNVSFEASVDKFRNGLDILLAECSPSTVKSRYFSPYWSKLNALLFHN